MKKTLGIVMVFSLVGALTVMAQEVKPGKVEIIDLEKGIKLEMVLIPAGKFMMGSKKPDKPLANEFFQPNELHQHEVTLTKSFYMGKYEITQEQWDAVMGNKLSKNKGPNLPINELSWQDCQEYIKKLNAKTNGNYRLPTEAEWEYACRAGTTTLYSFENRNPPSWFSRIWLRSSLPPKHLLGGSISPIDANYYASGIGQPVAVGSHKPNRFGLYDMHGNVWEWCEDWYGDYIGGPETDPKGPAKGDGHVARGGSFSALYGSSVRSASRVNGALANRNVYGGFRLARTP